MDEWCGFKKFKGKQQSFQTCQNLLTRNIWTFKEQHWRRTKMVVAGSWRIWHEASCILCHWLHITMVPTKAFTGFQTVETRILRNIRNCESEVALEL